VIFNDGTFSPAKVTVVKGAFLEFENLNHVDVTLSSDFPFTKILASETTFDAVLDKVGTFSFWLESAPLAKGTIVVTP
jgi:hypothetical protein